LVAVEVYNAGQPKDRASHQKGRVRDCREGEGSFVLLGERKAVVQVLDERFKIARRGGRNGSGPQTVLYDAPVPVEPEHRAKLTEKKGVVRMGPAVSHHRIDLCS